MTKIKHIQISKFKGISELDLDLGGITLVTGKNNAGKTSVLEAVELAFDPQSVTKYGDNVGKLINSHKKEATITVDYIQDTQTSLTDYNDGPVSTSQIENRTVKIREPEPSEASKILVDAVLDVTTSESRGSYIIDRFASKRLRLNDENELGEELFEDAIREAITGFSQRQLVEWAKGNCVVLSVNGEEFPYVYLGENYDLLRNEIISVAVESIQGRIDNSQEPLFEGETELEGNDRFIQRILSDLLVPRFGKGRFVGEKPQVVEQIRFVADSIQLSPNNVNLDKENAAVRLSDIEDYVKDNRLVKNLDTLSLDQLVFSENGEKYQVPYEFMGDGFKAMIGVLWELSNHDVSHNVLLLEEAETHMHPAYINQLVYRLVELALKRDIQVIITTHNIDLIRSFFVDMNNDDVREYLTDDFTLIRMDPELPEVYDFDDAKKHSKELELDLRGL